MKSTKYGYCRVSAKDQNEDRQLLAMYEEGIEEECIFVDKKSGKDFNRPKYQQMVGMLAEDDVVYIKSIDRLGRNYEEILEQWKYITKEKKADIVVMDMPILDTRIGKDLIGTFLTDIVLSLLSYVAENERVNIRQRQAEGIAAAKARGVHFGLYPMPLPENFDEAYQLWHDNKLSVSKAAERCGMAKSTFYDKARQRMRG